VCELFGKLGQFMNRLAHCVLVLALAIGCGARSTLDDGSSGQASETGGAAGATSETSVGGTIISGGTHATGVYAGGAATTVAMHSGGAANTGGARSGAQVRAVHAVAVHLLRAACTRVA
jgi:hypothetical protein